MSRLPPTQLTMSALELKGFARGGRCALRGSSAARVASSGPLPPDPIASTAAEGGLVFRAGLAVVHTWGSRGWGPREGWSGGGEVGTAQ